MLNLQHASLCLIPDVRPELSSSQWWAFKPAQAEGEFVVWADMDRQEPFTGPISYSLSPEDVSRKSTEPRARVHPAGNCRFRTPTAVPVGVGSSEVRKRAGQAVYPPLVEFAAVVWAARSQAAFFAADGAHPSGWGCHQLSRCRHAALKGGDVGSEGDCQGAHAPGVASTSS